MADFCNQCAQVLDFPEGDLAGLLTAEDRGQGLVQFVLCEGCGPTIVDHLGNCLGAKPCTDNQPCLRGHTDPNKEG